MKNIINSVFGNWTVIGKDSKKSYYLCRCSCGTERSVARYSLISNKSLSCGCQQKRLTEQTWLTKYGVTNLSKAESIKEKKRNTCIKKYGVDNIFKHKETRQKIKETTQEKYGVDCVLFLPEVRKASQKASQTVKSREAISLGLTKHYMSSGVSFKVYCEKNNIPYSSIKQIINRYSLETAEHFCLNYKGVSKSSLETLFITKSEGIITSSYNRKPPEIDKDIRPDFRINDILINVDGLFWHNEKNKGQTYHKDIREKIESFDLRLLQFYEDEVINKSDIIYSILNNMLGKSTKVYARKCEIKEVSIYESRKFLNENHLMGYYIGKRFGLFYDNELICLMSCINKKKGLEISRFCTKKNYTVIGGFSKLLQYVIATYNPPRIISYVDRRYGNGNSLLKTGFTYSGTTIGWCWSDGIKRFNRLKCTDPIKAKKLGWYKIFDAGQSKYILERNSWQT